MKVILIPVTSTNVSVTMLDKDWHKILQYLESSLSFDRTSPMRSSTPSENFSATESFVKELSAKIGLN
jgi:hypothetical protein